MEGEAADGMNCGGVGGKKSARPLRGTKVQRPRRGLRARVAGRRHPREREWDRGQQITHDGSGG
jgi:hypothetical protein